MKKMVTLLVLLCIATSLKAQIEFVDFSSDGLTCSSSNSWVPFLVDAIHPDRTDNSACFWIDNDGYYTFDGYGAAVIVEDVNSRAKFKLLNEGDVIDDNSSWHESTEYPDLPIIVSSDFNVWLGETGYAGVKIYTENGYRNGWMKFSVNSSGNEVTLLSAAWNTQNGGAIEAGQTTATDVEDNLPFSYNLEQNYPNPFNPSTTLNYSLAKAGNVKLSIFNVLGQQVAELVNGYKNAGNYKVNFNAMNLTTGVYFYRLETAEFVSTKKMQLIK